MLTDILTAKQQGFMTILLSGLLMLPLLGEESVDKAVALSGTTIYSRPVKVSSSLMSQRIN
ncbi:hypothetical protein Pyn_27961 [Prunus yedoensis var. nudiflora]|uniref:Uncharacterized protein n=1 Tax=Prunus yedoensis var. nudiflora TaxID=2094558 RepID=A0A314Z160_PRUYE|nr:hypothetical protein Pyn_27961 [Prunus yedoensis var. nudiflora]